MAQYNANIRVGITGKTQLDSLEKQLKRINTQVKTLNKSLQLKTRAQTIKLETRGAMTAVRQLEDRINRLGRTITVNLKVNEKGRRSSDSGGGGSDASGFAAGAGLAALAKPAAVQKIQAARRAGQEILKTEKVNLGQLERLEAGREKIKQRMIDDQKEINKLVQQRLDLEKKINTVENSASDKARTANQNRLFGGLTDRKGNKRSPAQAMNDAKMKVAALDRQVGKLGQSYQKNKNLFERFSGVTARYWGREKRRIMNVADAYDEVNRKIQKQQELTQKSAANKGKFTKGLQVGGGTALASILGNVPVLGEAVTGGLVAKLTGVSVAAGAVAGAVVALLGVLGKLGKDSAEVAARVDKLNLSLRIVAGEDYEKSLKTIQRVVNDFNTPLDTATEAFTKLSAAGRAADYDFKSLEDVFVGLTAANKVLAGDTEDFNGVMRALIQIISKGTLSSEELKMQIGDRLPGAFAAAAESLGMTTKQLAKALEQGEVDSKEFITKFGEYMLQYEEDAKKIGDTPAEAGARLEVAMTNLKVALGPLTKAIGAMFQDMGTNIFNTFTDIINKVKEYRKEMAGAALASGEADLLKARQKLTRARKAFQENPNFVTEAVLDQAMREVRENLRYLNELKEILGLNTTTAKAAKTKVEKTEEETGLTKEQLERQQRLAEIAADQRRSAAQKLALSKAELEITMAKTESEKIYARLYRDNLRIRQDTSNAIEDSKSEAEKQMLVERERVELQRAAYEAKLDVIKLVNEGMKEEARKMEEEKQRLQDMKDFFKNFWEDIASQLPEDPLKASLEESVNLVGTAIEDTIVQGLDAAITKAKDLGEVLSDIGRQLLGDVGRLFLRAAIGQGTDFATSLFRANGGPITGGRPYVVGERGPELIVPAQAGTVYNNNAFDAARASMQSSGQMEATNAAVAVEVAEAQAVSSPTDITVRYESSVINNVSYVTDEQFQAGLQQSANQARAATYKELRNRPASRAKAGVR